MRGYTSITENVLQTQVPGQIEGRARTFTIRTEVKGDSCETSVYRHRLPGVYNPAEDKYFIVSSHRYAAWSQHRQVTRMTEELFGSNPTEAFEKHCRIYDPNTNP